MNRKAKRGLHLFLSVVLALSMVVGMLPVNSAVSYAEDEPEYIEIYTAEDFYNIRNDLDASYVLMNDIDLSQYENWEMIGSNSVVFSGILDGNGHEVSGVIMTTSSTDDVGMISRNQGIIKNLTIHGTINSSSAGRVGGLVGMNDTTGTITNCFVDIIATATYAPSTAVVTGLFGGITGRNEGLIENCVFNGSVTGTTRGSAAYGNYCYTGGVAGSNAGIIRDCYNTGSIRANSRATGTSTSYSKVVARAAGITPNNVVTMDGTVVNCYNAGSISGSSDGPVHKYGVSDSGSDNYVYYLANDSTLKGTGTRLTESQMKVPESFDGFDFDSIWFIDERSSFEYPQLRNNPHIGTKSVVSISVINPIKQYVWDEDLDFSDIILTVEWDDGSIDSIPLSSDMYDGGKVEWGSQNQEIEIYYKGLTTVLSIQTTNPEGQIAGIDWSISEGGTLTLNGTGIVSNDVSSAMGFWKDRVNHIVITDGISGIENGVFEDYEGLETITMPFSIASYAENAKQGTSATIKYTGASNSFPEIAELIDQADELNNRIQALEDGQITQNAEAISQLTADLTALQTTVNALDETYATDSDIAALNSSLSQMRTDLTEAITSAVDAAKTELETKIEALEDGQVSENAAAITQLATDLGTLQSVVNALDDTYATDSDIAVLNSSLSQMRTDLTEAITSAVDAAKTELETKIEALQDGQVTENATAISQLTADLTALQTAVNALDDTYATDSDIAALNNSLSEMRTDLTSAISSAVNATKAELEAKIEALQDGQVTENATAISQLTADLTALQTAVNTLDETYATDEDIATLNDELSQMRTDLTVAISSAVSEVKTELEAKIDALRDGQVTENASAISQLTADLTALQTAVNALDETYATDSDIAALNNSLSEMRTDLTSAISSAVNVAKAELEAQIEALQDGQVTDNATAISQLTADLTALQTAVNALDETYATDSDIAALNNSLSEMRDDLTGAISSAVSTAKTELETKIEALENGQVAENVGAIQQLSTQLAALQTLIGGLDETYATDEDIDDLTGSLSEMRAELVDAISSAVSAAKAELDTKIQALENGQVADNTEAISELATEVTALQALVDALDESYATDADLLELNREVAAVRTDLTEAIQSTVAAAKAELEAEILALENGQVAENTETINQLVTELVALQEAIESLDESYATDAEIGAVRNELTSMVNSLRETLIESIGGLQEQLDENASILEGLDDTYATDASVIQAIENAQNAITTAQRAIDAAQNADIAGLISAIEDAKTAATIANSETLAAAKSYTDVAVAALQEQINTNTAALGALDETYATDEAVTGAIESAQQAVRDAQALVDAAQNAELSDLADAINDAKGAIITANAATLEAANAYTDAKCAALQAQYDELQEELNRLKAEIAQNSINTVGVSITAKANGETAVDLSWNTTKVTVDGNKIKYSVYCKEAAADTWELIYEEECNGDGKPMQYTVEGLASATEYQFYVIPSLQVDDTLYTGAESVTATVTLKKKVTPELTLSADAYTYDGKAKKPTVTVADGDTVLDESQYTVTYGSGRKNVGKYSVKVTLKDKYSGTKTVYFKINPKGATIKTPAAASKAVTVKWTKQSAKMSTARISGYQIMVATNSKFTAGKKTVNVAGYSKTSKKVTGLKGGKKYYVKVRTYRTVSGVKYYSPWSKTKTVTTKK